MKHGKALMCHTTRCKSPLWSGMRFGVMVLAALMAGITSRSIAAESESHAQKNTSPEYRYHYVSLDEATPPGFDFLDPFKLTNRGFVFANAYACPSSCSISIAVYRRGTTTILQDGIGYTANERGTVGGSVLIDPDNFIEQAALFTRGGVERIPRLPGEYSSHVMRLTDSGIALVESVDSTTFESTFYLYKRGHVIPLDLGSGQVSFLDVNDHGLIAGTVSAPGLNDRAFRFDPSSGTMTLLNPLPTEPDSWGQGINRDGDVLGYSFVSGGLERIGVWRHGSFQTYFVEGTPQFPTVSNRLLWNDKGLIVITRSRSDLNSYLVPRPGVRLRLADLADRVPVWTAIVDVNSHGDLIGYGGPDFGSVGETFLLQRLGGRR